MTHPTGTRAAEPAPWPGRAAHAARAACIAAAVLAGTAAHAEALPGRPAP